MKPTQSLQKVGESETKRKKIKGCQLCQSGEMLHIWFRHLGNQLRNAGNTAIANKAPHHSFSCFYVQFPTTS